MDRISELPESIVHRTLSFLNTWNAPSAELVRMSVLSKTWFHLTASFPTFDFNINDFKSRESFYKYVDYTTSRFCHQDVTANRLMLITTIREPAELDIVNRCLELVLKKGVKLLLIGITSLAKYRLPNILLSVSMLKSLIIHGCELPSSLTVDAVKFKSLIQLRLVNVPIDDEAIKCLATSCPLLQIFYIRHCHGFKRFCVYGHKSLGNVWIEYNTRVEKIDIEAPNLSSLSIIDSDGAGAPQMNFASCEKLTTVTYNGYPLPNSNGFTNFLSNFPFVENLVLITKNKCNNLKLSSHSLRTLVLHSNCVLEEIEFSTPNLVSFSFVHNPLFLLSEVKYSTNLKGCMRCYPDGSINTIWFQKLRLFLDRKNGFKVLNLYIHALYSQKVTELEKLKAIELPPYELEHVELQLESHGESLAHIAFVEAVIWCCRPRSLTLRSSFPFEEQSDLVKFTYEKLLQQEEQGHTNIQTVSPSSSLLMALPPEGKAINFIKEEVLQEEAGNKRFAGLKIL